MTLRLVMTRRAESDLSRIKTYIAQQNPSAADRVRQRIRQSIMLLCDYPYLGRPTGKTGVLMTSVPRYRYKIYFTVAGDELRIIHIRQAPERSLWSASFEDRTNANCQPLRFLDLPPAHH